MMAVYLIRISRTLRELKLKAVVTYPWLLRPLNSFHRRKIKVSSAVTSIKKENFSCRAIGSK